MGLFGLAVYDRPPHGHQPSPPRCARPRTKRRQSIAAPSADAEPLDALVAEESRRRLWDLASDVLSEEQTTALWLFYVEDMPVRGIARVLGRSRASVKIMLFRARRKLLPLVAELDEESRRRPTSHKETQRRRPHAAKMEVPYV